MKLATHTCLVSRLRICGDLPPDSFMSSWLKRNGTDIFNFLGKPRCMRFRLARVSASMVTIIYTIFLHGPTKISYSETDYETKKFNNSRTIRTKTVARKQCWQIILLQHHYAVKCSVSLRPPFKENVSKQFHWLNFGRILTLGNPLKTFMCRGKKLRLIQRGLCGNIFCLTEQMILWVRKSSWRCYWRN
jgi:hypothetical protein